MREAQLVSARRIDQARYVRHDARSRVAGQEGSFGSFKALLGHLRLFCMSLLHALSRRRAGAQEYLRWLIGRGAAQKAPLAEVCVRRRCSIVRSHGERGETDDAGEEGRKRGRGWGIMTKVVDPPSYPDTHRIAVPGSRVVRENLRLIPCSLGGRMPLRQAPELEA